MANREVIQRTALFSPDRVFRYSLTRIWDDRPPVVFIGLNPSTADEEKDDPTITGLIAKAHIWNAGGLVMLNLFAFRATKPLDMFRVAYKHGVGSVIGRENTREKILSMIGSHGAAFVVCGWGTSSNKGLREMIQVRGDEVARSLQTQNGMEIFCLDRNQDGTPKHPLYVKHTTTLKPLIKRNTGEDHESTFASHHQ